MENIDYQLLDSLVASDTLEDMLKRAKNGDVKAAKDALLSIAEYLYSNIIKTDNGDLLPVPIFIREYLSKAFYNMAEGMSPETALNLKRAGRKKQNHLETRAVAYLVYQAVHVHGQKIEDAIVNVEKFIKEKNDLGALIGYLKAYESKHLGSQSIVDWYYRHKEELGKMSKDATIQPIFVGNSIRLAE